MGKEGFIFAQTPTSVFPELTSQSPRREIVIRHPTLQIATKMREWSSLKREVIPRHPDKL
jgi:hypothetical protein